MCSVPLRLCRISHSPSLFLVGVASLPRDNKLVLLASAENPALLPVPDTCFLFPPVDEAILCVLGFTDSGFSRTSFCGSYPPLLYLLFFSLS